MGEQFLVMGNLQDLLTGLILEDTPDERYRQKVARLLVDEKGFSPDDISARHRLQVEAGETRATLSIDFLVKLSDRLCLLVSYGPGSLVTRHRPVLGMSRLVADYQIPRVVVTNGVDADTLDGYTGKIVARGFEGIPTKAQLMDRLETEPFTPVPQDRLDKESRIVLAFHHIDQLCPSGVTGHLR